MEGQSEAYHHVSHCCDDSAIGRGSGALQRWLMAMGEDQEEALIDELVREDKSKMAYRAGHLEKCIV
jgi:hypothetical protein